MRKRIQAALLLIVGAQSAFASETITYSYDALGRMVATGRSGSVNSGQQTIYAYDKADNRTNVTTTGASH